MWLRKADTFATVAQVSLQDLIDQVRTTIDPRLRERARNKLAARIREIAVQAVARMTREAIQDDVAQAVFLKVEPHLLSDEINDPDGYVIRAARNQFYSHARRPRLLDIDTVGSEGEVDVPVAPNHSPEKEMILREDLSILHEALEEMNPRYRELITRVRIQEESPERLVDEEMARPENHGKSRPTVRNSCIDQPLSRAMKQLAEKREKLLGARARRNKQ